ncbi:MAG: amylo-alpha-1,6-glucosidase [Desulfomonilia bacterium]|jgi:glycogen debranching enzyme
MAEEIIDISGEHYVLATTALAVEQNRVVKHSNTFGVFDTHGDIQARIFSNQGLFHNGTRYLSRQQFFIEGRRPLLLSSDITRDNHLFTVDLTNPDLILSVEKQIQRGALHVFRSKFIWEGRCYEKYRIRNFGLEALSLTASLAFAADFADIFEVRGMRRRSRGQTQEPVIGPDFLELPYLGLDGITRRTRIELSLKPETLQADRAAYLLLLDRNEEVEFEVVVSCIEEREELRARAGSYLEAYRSSARHLSSARGRESSIRTSNEEFNTLVDRAVSDLRMLMSEVDGGMLYPDAGIPWFSTPFGRDGLITAWETLWFNPDIARDVLKYLAENQASEVIEEQDAEPGKILHEKRMGEMTNTGELPFSRYYGSADATPFFVMLAGAYLMRTGDREFAEMLWPPVRKALEWIDDYGDMDRDGFVEYASKSDRGLRNQVWKDSFDSTFHADGSLAEPPVAACEVQAYVFAARKLASFIAQQLGLERIASDLLDQAADLKRRFEKAFWDDELPGYVPALDRDKRPCRVRVSNMGHCLFAGITSPDRARIVTRELMDGSFFSGWGVRTLAVGQARYNPMSYHNGSIWPHDNALIAEGMARYGWKEEAGRILEALFSMSRFFELGRIPELFCGFERRPNQGPTFYPVACSPQAWAAASVFSLLRSCLGLTVRASSREVHFTRPYLPEFLESVKICNLAVGQGTIDFAAKRHRHDVSIQVLGRTGGISVSLTK